LDIKGEAGSLNGKDLQKRKDLFGELWRILKARNTLTVQQSRSKWFREDDANSKYFHKCVKMRSSKYMIKALKVNEGWVESSHDVRKEVVDYFTEHVSSITWERPKLDGVIFETLSEEENGSLVVPIERDFKRGFKNFNPLCGRNSIENRS